MGKKNSMVSATIVISMVIGLMNPKRNQNLKANFTNVEAWAQVIKNAKQRY